MTDPRRDRRTATPPMTEPVTSERSPRIPLWLKIAYSAFVLVLVPSYWRAYGPSNFLFLCDVAVFVTLVALWKESALLASAAAVGIIIPQIVWYLDYALGMFGYFPFGLTKYMFEHETLFEWYYDGLSFFHGWLPFLVVYLVAKLGYDRRALVTWTVAAWVLLIICYLWMPPPGGPPKDELGREFPRNINYVYGFADEKAQEWMHPHLWFAFVFVGLPLLVCLPTHRVLNRWRGRGRGHHRVLTGDAT